MTPSVLRTDPSNSITLRVKLSTAPGVLPNLIMAVTKAGGEIVGVDIICFEGEEAVRAITINTADQAHVDQIIEAASNVSEVELLRISDRTFAMHQGGKIEVKSRVKVTNRDQLSMAYTPGVAKVCTAIQKKPEEVFRLTVKQNMVAVVSDGTAVLGLGDIGPEAALPVMEGKVMLFKDFAGVDAFPICLDTKDSDEIVQTIKNIAPVFGGINLEDISAPRCFEIEKRLQEELDIPVFHDDQHGTAVVLTAAFINALKITGKKAEELKVVFAGIGAAGTACTKMLLNIGVKNIIGCDRKGAVSKERTDLNEAKKEYASLTNPYNETGTIHQIMKGADVFIGLSGPDVITVEDVQSMNQDPIVFAMSNPIPEIMPELAYPHVKIMATGRSDYPNQINNVLCFPGFFRGALDCQATRVTESMKIAAAYAIADVVKEDQLSPDYIVPSVFDPSVSKEVAKAVKEAAIKSGVARKKESNKNQ